MIALAAYLMREEGSAAPRSGRSRPPGASGSSRARTPSAGAAYSHSVQRRTGSSGGCPSPGRPAGALCRATCNLDKARPTRLAAAIMRAAAHRLYMQDRMHRAGELDDVPTTAVADDPWREPCDIRACSMPAECACRPAARHRRLRDVRRRRARAGSLARCRRSCCCTATATPPTAGAGSCPPLARGRRVIAIDVPPFGRSRRCRRGFERGPDRLLRASSSRRCSTSSRSSARRSSATRWAARWRSARAGGSRARRAAGACRARGARRQRAVVVARDLRPLDQLAGAAAAAQPGRAARR